MTTSTPPLLLTPGPLTTAQSTRHAMTADFGSRDQAFIQINREVRQELVALCADPSEYTAVLMQGSGTFAVEATFGTLLPRDGKALVCINGAYGRRITQMIEVMGRAVVTLKNDETEPTDLVKLDAMLAADPDITHVAAVHCETTTGMLNPIEAIAEVTRSHGRELIIDAMSAFGALPLHASKTPFQAVVASSNKCLEGVPGFGYCIARTADLKAASGNAHSLSLDLSAQLSGFDKNAQWRFTPPTQVIAAFREALRLHAAEGGVAGRGKRYAENCKTLVEGLRGLGFETLLPDALQAPIIVTVRQPSDPRFHFERFYDALRDEGFAIYPGKLTQAPTFRVGCIGQVFPEDLTRFVQAVSRVLESQEIASAAP